MNDVKVTAVIRPAKVCKKTVFSTAEATSNLLSIVVYGFVVKYFH